MLADRVRGTFRIVLLLQLLAASAAFLLCYVALFHWNLGFKAVVPVPDSSKYLLYATISLCAVAFTGLGSSLPPSFPQLGALLCQRLALAQTFNVAVALSVYVVLAKDIEISRLFVLIFLPLLWLFLSLGWRYLPVRVARAFFQNERLVRLILCGNLQKAALMENWLKDRNLLGVRLLGIATNDPGESTRSSATGPDTGWKLPVLGRIDQLEELIQKHEANQLLLLDFPESRQALASLIVLTERKAVRLQILHDLDLLFGRSFVSFQDGGHSFVGIREEPLENPFNRSMKRVLDLAIAVPAALIFLPPAAVVAAMLQVLYSRGPLLHKQQRAGLNGRKFTIYKFRTMHQGAHNLAQQATSTDTRVFPGGRLLRKWSVDELPQIWNVIRGDMSLVGPRGHLPQHDEQFAAVYQSYHVRYNIKPGISGLAQVRGYRGEIKSAEDIRNRVASDLEYVETWSLWLDFWILFRTVGQVLRPPPSAY